MLLTTYCKGWQVLAIYSVSLRQWSWGMDALMHLSNCWLLTHWIDYNLSSTTNFPVIHLLPKDISLHHHWRIWTTGETQHPRSILTSFPAGRTIKEEWSYIKNRWNRKFGEDGMLVKTYFTRNLVVPCTGSCFYFRKFLFQEGKEKSLLAFVLALRFQYISDSFDNQLQPEIQS